MHDSKCQRSGVLKPYCRLGFWNPEFACFILTDLIFDMSKWKLPPCESTFVECDRNGGSLSVSPEDRDFRWSPHSTLFQTPMRFNKLSYNAYPPEHRQTAKATQGRVRDAYKLATFEAVSRGYLWRMATCKKWHPNMSLFKIPEAKKSKKTQKMCPEGVTFGWLGSKTMSRACHFGDIWFQKCVQINNFHNTTTFRRHMLMTFQENLCRKGATGCVTAT